MQSPRNHGKFGNIYLIIMAVRVVHGHLAAIAIPSTIVNLRGGAAKFFYVILETRMKFNPLSF